jgi:hypothetical protein
LIVDSDVPRSGSFGVFIQVGACARTRLKRKGKKLSEEKGTDGRKEKIGEKETNDR